eukprot:TRINITY_DN16794_c0_g2_i1.p1 TRINITY_DN16794_c0_g2~~TRINITY_DN16794_c0_g2_i1.p1  ORF type:complete len:2177 (+),score=202.36 TRINITY_DN16794_c0_g2_i1:55-6531(+)
MRVSSTMLAVLLLPSAARACAGNVCKDNQKCVGTDSKRCADVCQPEHCDNKQEQVFYMDIDGGGCYCRCRNSWRSTTNKYVRDSAGKRWRAPGALEEITSQVQGGGCAFCPSMYAGDCDRCATGMVGYPSCHTCNIAKHCSDHAKQVQPDQQKDICDCTCTTKWDGSDCSNCPTQYDSAQDCNNCAQGHAVFPGCPQCTDAANCNGHSQSVDSNAGRDACVCQCRVNWAGDYCDRCATGYIDYPGCDECTDAIHCSGHSTSVTSNSAQDGCDCVCRNKWTGPTCAVCPPQFEEADDCLGCATGYILPPQCVQCTTTDHCSSHAISVQSDATHSTCVCTCQAAYEGAACSACAANHIEYPKCELCTISQHCTGHASAVVDANRVSCTCTCTDQWTGASCSACPQQYDPGTCAACADGYITYPNCEQCTSAGHCHGHAADVKSDGTHANCICTCSARFTGVTCERCTPVYEDFPGGCKRCSPGRVGYPTCRECTTASDCSGHAGSVTDDGTRQSCACSCSQQWDGMSCANCPARYDSQRNCDACAQDYIDFPACTQCTNAMDCEGHASAVRSDSANTKCICSCTARFQGATCNACSARFDNYQSDCNECSQRRIGYPGCELCEVSKHCSNHAVAVDSDAGHQSCVCTCRNQWTGAACQACAPDFDQASDCDKCADGFIDYPGCEQCTSATHCNGHALSVISNPARTECLCTCGKRYAGPKCGACSERFDGYPQCGTCAEGYVSYDTCEKCDIAVHCSGHASKVTSNAARTACDCVCSSPWTAANCGTCPAKYEQGSNCARCADGHILYPTCERCTSDAHCHGHATRVVSDSSRTECLCTCGERFAQARCDACSARFDGYPGCASCAQRHVGYPTCELCDTAAHCKGHATAVDSNQARTACVCACRNKWAGAACEICEVRYDSGKDCGSCAQGYINYGACAQCTSAAHCNGHASGVDSDTTRKKCVCQCAARFTGSTCEACTPQYADWDNDCKKCAQGYIVYPTCTKCDSGVHCSGHASAVDSNAARDACVCDCRNKWTGSQCKECPAAFAGSDCDQCAQDHIVYPGCARCSSVTHCEGHATSVTSDSLRSKCLCTCADRYQGTVCNECQAQYDGYPNCDVCAEGYISFPTCEKCDIIKHCNGRATAVTSDALRRQCECQCTKQWTGGDCGTCPSQFDTQPDCDQCAAGHITYSTCTKCGIVQHCNGHAASVDSDAGHAECECVCTERFQGKTCSTCSTPFENYHAGCTACAQGYIGYPACTKCDKGVHCSGHAIAVDSNALRQECVCTCAKSWTSTDCGVCPSNYKKVPDCESCAPGYITYPTCEQCTSATHCNGHASTVTSDAANAECLCACLAAFQGKSCDKCSERFDGLPNCDKCAQGYITHPTCERCDVAVHCNGRAQTADSNAARTECVCTCRNAWTGSKCETCPVNFDQAGDCDECVAGYITYSACEQCTSAAHCNNRASVVVSNAQRTKCVCTCEERFTGERCESCSTRFHNEPFNCNKCAQGYITWPQCEECDVGAHCKGHATAVDSNTDNTDCVCTCRNQWTGAKCEVCPTQFEQLPDCNTCADGYIVYPNCVQCTSADHCKSHASAVASNARRTECICTCTERFQGDTCDACSARFEDFPNECEKCAQGYIRYPDCIRCDISVHCNGRATSVTSNSARTACVCTCTNQWTGSACDVCPPRFQQGVDCDRCAVGYIKYAACEKCTSAAHCNGHAAKVESNAPRTDCMCECTERFQGAVCDSCSTRFEDYIGLQCARCAQGYIDLPQCTKCDVVTHCSDHATGVDSNQARDRCDCTCRHQWTGQRCETCPPNFEQGGDCDKCAPGYTKYPTCSACDTKADCNGHASSTTSDGTRTKCLCTCERRFKGEACEQCADGFDGYSTGCVVCAARYIGYPNCEACDLAKHCSGHATFVDSNAAHDECDCTCEHQWTGSSCSRCPENFEAAANCAECAVGYVVYPSCEKCTSLDHCEGHAASVASNAARTECDCTCAERFAGKTCDKCSTRFDDYGGECRTCAQGYISYPACELCLVARHCSGHATSVDSNAARDACDCACRNRWAAADCSTCPKNYEQGGDCDECADGHIGYPVCIATTTLPRRRLTPHGPNASVCAPSDSLARHATAVPRDSRITTSAASTARRATSHTRPARSAQ